MNNGALISGPDKPEDFSEILRVISNDKSQLIDASAQGSAVTYELNTLNIFEEQFHEKYKIQFDDFVEVVMKDYPELKI